PLNSPTLKRKRSPNSNPSAPLKSPSANSSLKTKSLRPQPKANSTRSRNSKNNSSATANPPRLTSKKRKPASAKANNRSSRPKEALIPIRQTSMLHEGSALNDFAFFLHIPYSLSLPLKSQISNLKFVFLRAPLR